MNNALIVLADKLAFKIPNTVEERLSIFKRTQCIRDQTLSIEI